MLPKTPLLALAFLATALCAGRLHAQVAAPTPPAAQEEEIPDAPFSPRGAFFRSLVLPGWGQAYVGAPGRGAVYFSMTAGSLAMTWVARQQLLDARAFLVDQQEAGLVGQEAQTPFVNDRERHFEDWAALSIFLMFLSGADAYVSAYLADFDERIGVVPTRSGLEFRTRIPLGSR